MKQEETNNLKIFGFGVALIPSYLFFMDIFKEIFAPGFGMFLLYFFVFLIFALWIISLSVKYHIVYLIVLSGLLIFDIRFQLAHGSGLFTIIFYAVSLVFYSWAWIHPPSLKPVYDKWMGAAHFIGFIISNVILSILYIIAFVPAGIVIRLLQKDLLNQKIDHKASSYWIIREDKFDKDSCLRQF